MSLNLRFPISENSQVGEVRRNAMNMGMDAGLDEPARGRLGIIATELATNLLKHAKQGEILLSSVPEKEGKGIRILALDRGPGMIDIGKSLYDGHSTAGSPGTGLGAIQRLSDFFEIQSIPKQGTGILAQVGGKAPQGVTVGSVRLPYPGERVCGDAFVHLSFPEKELIMVVDGLGHGPMASEASEKAISILSANAKSDYSMTQLMGLMHTGLYSTRGAAVSLCELNLRTRKINFIGVGNVSGLVAPPYVEARHFVCMGGTVGHSTPSIKNFEYPWPQNSILCLYSDGLSGRWGFADHPGLKSRHPALMAGVLYRDYQRGRDDVTVLVVKEI